MTPYFRLITIDDRPLPTPVVIRAATYVVEEGEFQLIPGNGFQGDGAVRWRLFGLWPDGRRDMIFIQQEPFRLVTPTRLEFPVDRPPLPTEYSAEEANGALVLSSRTVSERPGSPVGIFGQDHTWRFVSSNDHLVR